MEAVAEYGIPMAFVVRDGKIAWIGPPLELELDGPLAKLVGTTASVIRRFEVADDHGLLPRDAPPHRPGPPPAHRDSLPAP